MTALSDRLAHLRKLRGPAAPDFAAGVRTLVVVASSSRGGSSMLTELLRLSPALLHLRGEINPFLRLVGLDHPHSGTGSDELGAAHLNALDAHHRRILDEELGLDAGTTCDRVDDDEEFALDAAWRFAVQWPEIDFDPDTWVRTALRVLRTLRRDRGWPPHHLPDPGAFVTALVTELARKGLPVHLAHYDLPRAHPASARPGRVLVEEPPFILPRPWRRADAADLAAKPLVIKTPSNAYRLGFLRALFPNARIRMLHLLRNPAASVNGLYDGWRFNGFHAHRMARPLRIAGYTDPWWWKFDLPPGWQAVADQPLARVCAFQWASAHRAILASGGGLDYLAVRFEDLIRTPASRLAELERITDWLGVALAGDLLRAAHHGVAPVVATAPPRPGRWRHRAATVRQALGPEVRELAERLGYADESAWI